MVVGFSKISLLRAVSDFDHLKMDE